MAHFIVNVEIIVKRDDRFLMIIRSDEEDFGAGWLCFPGGTLDAGTADMHALELTAQRELMEEVALDVSIHDLAYVESHTFLIGDQTVLDVVFMTENAADDPQAMDPAEVAEVMWMTRDEIMQDSRVQPFTRESLRLAIDRCTTRASSATVPR